MKILIIGNIGCGKTTLGKKIAEITNFNFIQIDNLRQKYLKKHIYEEYYCLYLFLKYAEAPEDVILEFTGAGCHKYAVRRALELSKQPVLILVCQTSMEKIKQRILSKQYPYPNLFSISIENHIFFIQNEIENDLKNNFWKVNDLFFVKTIKMNTWENLRQNISLIKRTINNLLR